MVVFYLFIYFVYTTHSIVIQFQENTQLYIYIYIKTSIYTCLPIRYEYFTSFDYRPIHFTLTEKRIILCVFIMD